MIFSASKIALRKYFKKKRENLNFYSLFFKNVFIVPRPLNFWGGRLIFSISSTVDDNCPFRGLLCRGVSIFDVRASVRLSVVMVSRSDLDLDGSSNYLLSYVRDVDVDTTRSVNWNTSCCRVG